MKRLLGGGIAALLLFAQPAVAQSMLRDAETEALLNDMARPIAVSAGLDPRNFSVVLLQDKSINAFVAGGQTVYIHSGLIDAADDANEVQGVIAHEIGHIVGGHVPLAGRGMAPATGITVLSLLLGVAAMAAGAGEAGAGILAAGQQAAMGSYLSFSRTQETSADAAGARFLRGADVSGQGMLDFFKKLQNLEYRLAIPQDNSYQRTHPLSGERIANLTADVQASPAFKRATDPALELRFKRVQAKLRGYVSDPRDTLRRYPDSDQSVMAHYARAYAYHKSGYPEQAAAETLALVKAAPDDPYFLELEGQILLESGKPKEALAALREATERTRSSPLIAATFGHALIAAEDPALLPEAERVLKQAIARDGQNPFAWYQLSILYERRGDPARVALAMAEYASLSGDTGMALASARRAMALLPQGSSDWIRAQDIQMTSQTAAEEERRNRRRQVAN
ncbi:M48 family metalloprotease [Sphingomonas silueang]|uniref:M48 family metalloprotease n=1 Tax=Sphingomonas silueang TaxID=3156617 RepID=UPI0032B61D41